MTAAAFHPVGGRSRWQVLYEHVRDYPTDETISVSEIIELMRQELEVSLGYNDVVQLIGVMNEKVANDGFRLISVGRQHYKPGTPAEKLHVATAQTSRKIMRVIRRGKQATQSVLRDETASDRERAAAADAAGRWDDLHKTANKTRRKMLGLAPELPRYVKDVDEE